MPITEGIINRVRYPPELLPDAIFTDIAAAQEAAPPVLDIRHFPGKLLRLAEIAVERDDEVEVRIKADDYGLLSSFNVTGGFYDLASTVSPAANSFQMLAVERLYYNLFASVAKTDFRTSHGVWVQNLTVADKLKLKLSLTPEEKALDTEFGIAATVEKGLLPLPLEQQIEREYRSQIISLETHGRTMSPTTTSKVVETVYPRDGEFAVLTALAATPGDEDDNIRISITRDNDVDYITGLKTFAVGLERDLKCFIPAISEIIINIVSAAGAPTTYVRYTIMRCRLSNLLRARFGLVSKDELPGDTFKKVLCGIL